MITWPNQDVAAIRRPTGQSDGSGDLSATLAADRSLPGAVAELERYVLERDLPVSSSRRTGF